MSPGDHKLKGRARPLRPSRSSEAVYPRGPQLVRSAWSVPPDQPTAPATASARRELTYEPDPLFDESRTRTGRVFNIGSVDGLRPPTSETYSYAASKAAVHQLTRHLARRLAPKVLVNCIAPGPFRSRMMAATLRDFGPGIERSNPLGRVGTANDIQGAALLLASRAGACITGSILAVDGGLASIGGAA